jgi:hypothetical protein
MWLTVFQLEIWMIVSEILASGCVELWATTVGDVGCQWQGELASHPVSLRADGFSLLPRKKGHAFERRAD